jgi:hypothetical protein
MIRVVLGKPGSGKTLYMLWLMGQYLAAGRPVATNIRLTKACPFYNRVAMLDDDEAKWPVFQEPDKDRDIPYRAFWHYLNPNGLAGPWAIFVDEADNYWDSSEFGRLNVAKDVRLYHKQHRKLKHDIIYSVQNLDNLYVRVRRMVQSFVVCEYTRRSSRLYKYLPSWCQKFCRAEFTSEQFGPKTLVGNGSFTWWEAKKMFTWYTTEQLIGDTSFYADWRKAG